jgi:hypothetical protein
MIGSRITEGEAARDSPSGQIAPRVAPRMLHFPLIEDGERDDERLAKEQCAHIGHRGQDIDPIILEETALRHLDKVGCIPAPLASVKELAKISKTNTLKKDEYSSNGAFK